MMGQDTDPPSHLKHMMNIVMLMFWQRHTEVTRWAKYWEDSKSQSYALISFYKLIQPSVLAG